MKRVILTFICVCAMTLQAQTTDGGANSIMQELATQYKAYTTMQINYTYKVEKNKAVTQSLTGKAYIKGNKYQITFGDQIFYCDGVSLWNYQKSTNEVSIYEYDPEDDENMMNPQRLLKNWEKQFRAKFIRDEFVNNVSVSLVDLTPKVAQSFYRIRLFINKSNKQIVRIALYEKDNTIYTYYIEQFNSNATFPDIYFTFDKSKYPGVEVNDMR